MGISTHNGTLTISEILETDPGYDMGANHTYRYVKTSGLGALPLKWPGDTFTAQLNSNYVSTLQTCNFRVAWITSSQYEIICAQTSGNASKNYETYTIARNYLWHIEIDAGVISINSKIIDDCTIPTVYQATFGEVNYVGNNKYPAHGAINISSEYWVKNESGQNSYKCYASSPGYLTTYNIEYNFATHVTPFVEVPF